MNNLKRFPVAVLIASIQMSIAYADSIKTDCKKETSSSDQKCREIMLDPIVVTANRTEIDSAKYAGQVGTINSEGLVKNNRIVDDLSSIPGIDLGRDAGRQIGQNFAIRGFGYQSEERVIIQQDGVPRSVSLFSNHISSFRTDTDILKKVEVVKGASSVLHGSGAIGGIVSMRTKDAFDYLRPKQEFGASIGARIESNNMHSNMVALYGKPRNLPIDFLLHGKRAKYGKMKIADGGTEDLKYIPNQRIH